MKKLLCLLTVLMMVSSVACASSSTGRLMSKKFYVMTDDEILEMYDLIMGQIERRGLSPYNSEQGVKVPAGVYRIGDDIPQGSYRIVFPEDRTDYGVIFLYDKDGELLRSFTVGNLNNVPEIGKLDLINGMTFELDNTSSVFYAYKGLFGDWNE